MMDYFHRGVRIVFFISALTNIALALVNDHLRRELQTRLDELSKTAECGPDTPKVVPYHQGMTLCPGQSAVGSFVIPMFPEPDEQPVAVPRGPGIDM